MLRVEGCHAADAETVALVRVGHDHAGRHDAWERSDIAGLTQAVIGLELRDESIVAEYLHRNAHLPSLLDLERVVAGLLHWRDRLAAEGQFRLIALRFCEFLLHTDEEAGAV